MVSLGVLPTPINIAVESIFPFVSSPDDQSLVSDDLVIVSKPKVSEKIRDWWRESDPLGNFNPPLTTGRFRERLRQVLSGKATDYLYVRVCQTATNTFNTLIRQTNSFLPENRQTDERGLIINFDEEREIASQPRIPTGLDVLMARSPINYGQLFQKSPSSNGSGPAGSPSSSGSHKSPSPMNEQEAAAAAGTAKKRRKKRKRHSHPAVAMPLVEVKLLPIKVAVS